MKQMNRLGALSFRLTEERAVRLRQYYSLITAVSFLDTYEIVEQVSDSLWSPTGLMAPIFDFVNQVWGREMLFQLQPYSVALVVLALLVAAVGYRPRLAFAVAAVFSLFCFSLTVAARGVRHPEAPMIVSLFLASLAPWSSPKDRFVDLWTIHLQRALFVFVFAASGLQKIWLSGAGWLEGDALKHHLLWAQLAYAHMEPSALQLGLNQTLASLPDLVIKVLGIGVVGAELLLPFFLYVKRVRAAALLLLLLMVVLFRFALFVPFNGIYVLFVFWLGAFDRDEAVGK
ncbi:MAG: hypothetical protein JNJ49_05120 [Bdellovibrionaceae bacterium]|nr:hypothetical protein [Pseudobdellovibrionaceae bacterium]